MDLVLYPGYMIDPDGLGSPTRLSLAGDASVSLPAFCSSSTTSYLAGVGCWVWFAVAVALAVLFAMIGTYHLFAFLGIASGLYVDEEWPPFMDRPSVADSLNDLWGKRYHQVSPAQIVSRCSAQREHADSTYLVAPSKSIPVNLKLQATALGAVAVA